MNNTLKISLTSLVVLASVPLASAALVASFDFGQSAAATAPGGSAPVAGPAGTPASWGQIDGGNFSSPPTQGGLQFFVYNSSGFNDSRALNDLLSSTVFELNGGNGANWHMTGLSIGTVYRVSFIAADGTGFGGSNTYNTQYSVYDADPGANGSNKGTVNLIDSVDVNPVDLGAGGFDGTWTAGVTYGAIEFTANASTMYGLWEKLPAGSHSGIGAVQIETVPEPASSTLLALGSLAVLVRRRR